jgi:hypothetical protein
LKCIRSKPPEQRSSARPSTPTSTSPPHNGGELVQPVGDDDPLQSPESGALGGGEICGQQKNQTREEEDIEEPLRGVPVSRLFSDLHLEG